MVSRWRLRAPGLGQAIFCNVGPPKSITERRLRRKKIKFINLFFLTEKTYRLHPETRVGSSHFYGGHLQHNDVFDVARFLEMAESEQDQFMWGRAHEVLCRAAKATKNVPLLEAADYAYTTGVATGMDPDYRMLEADVVLRGLSLKAAVWVRFRKDGMYSSLTLEKDGSIVFERPIDRADNGVEFFLEMYIRLDVDGNDVIVKCARDVSYSPLRVSITPSDLGEVKE